MSTLFGKLPKLSRVVESKRIKFPSFDSSLATYVAELKSSVLEEAVSRVLQLPAVASKMFLITIGVGYTYPRSHSVSRSVASTYTCIKKCAALFARHSKLLCWGVKIMLTYNPLGSFSGRPFLPGSAGLALANTSRGLLRHCNFAYPRTKIWRSDGNGS